MRFGTVFALIRSTTAKHLSRRQTEVHHQNNRAKRFMSYTFTRIRKRGTDEYGTWYFKPMSIDDVQLHWDTVCRSQIRDHVNERFSKAAIADDGTIIHPHPTTQFGLGVEAYMQAVNDYYVLGMVHVENEAYNSRMRSFENGQDIYLSNGMTVLCPDSSVCEIVETVEVDKFAYPDQTSWSMKDVRYMQWNMLGNKGEHWYAKIGNRDVIDQAGNMKWDSKSMAEEAARWFIKEKLGGMP